MRAFGIIALAAVAAAYTLFGQDLAERARQRERSGDVQDARQILQRAARGAAHDAAALAAYAEFLDRYRDPGTRGAYERLLAALGPSEREQRVRVARRLLELDLLD